MWSTIDLTRTEEAALMTTKKSPILDFSFISITTISSAFRSVAAAKKSRELAERNLDAEKKKYENGMTTSFTVAQIQNDLTTARTNELQAIAAYQKAITAWHRAIGDLLDQKSISLDGMPVTIAATAPEEGAVR